MFEIIIVMLVYTNAFIYWGLEAFEVIEWQSS